MQHIKENIFTKEHYFIDSTAWQETQLGLRNIWQWKIIVNSGHRLSPFLASVSLYIVSCSFDVFQFSWQNMVAHGSQTQISQD